MVTHEPMWARLRVRWGHKFGNCGDFFCDHQLIRLQSWPSTGLGVVGIAFDWYRFDFETLALKSCNQNISSASQRSRRSPACRQLSTDFPNFIIRDLNQSCYRNAFFILTRHVRVGSSLQSAAAFRTLPRHRHGKFKQTQSRLVNRITPTKASYVNAVTARVTL